VWYQVCTIKEAGLTPTYGQWTAPKELEKPSKLGIFLRHDYPVDMNGVPFVSNGFDTNGVLYHLGTMGGTAEYMNPHLSGQVEATMSSVANQSQVERFTQHNCTMAEKQFNYTGSIRWSWMAVDLLKGRSLHPVAYCLRSDSHVNGHKLRDWELQGATADKPSEWVVLMRHDNDLALEDHALSVVAVEQNE
jgi:hypothetical protein